MPVHYILANLLADNDRAVGALFLDDSGETVDLATSELTPYKVRVVGAYLGIYLRQFERICQDVGIEAPERIHIEKDDLHIYAQALPDGYYLVLLQRRPGLVGKARRSLQQAGEELRREFF
jgi:hypothetical protein